jgi:hypothetical protein
VAVTRFVNGRKGWENVVQASMDKDGGGVGWIRLEWAEICFGMEWDGTE